MIVPIKQNETAILCLSKVNNMLVGTNHRDWKYPASTVIAGENSTDLETSLGEEMVALLDEPDVTSKMIAFSQLGRIRCYKPALPKVREYLYNKDQMLRFGACWVIMESLNYDTLPEVWKVLEQPLENDSRELADAFEWALSAIDTLWHHPQGFLHIVDLLESSKPILRETAAKRVIISDRSRKYIIDALKSDKQATRFTMLKALARTTDDPTLIPTGDMTIEEEALLIKRWLSLRPFLTDDY